MHYEFPLVFFTVLTQLAAGLTLAAAWQEWQPAGRHGEEEHQGLWRTAFAAAAVGLLASFFHLADPLRAFTALNNLGHSWLSREGLVFGLFALLLLTRCFVSSRLLSLLAALAGILGVVMQGLTYAPVSMPAINNSLPFFLFALTALSLGTTCSRMHSLLGLQRLSLCGLLLLLLVVPCLWTSGNALMQATASAWKGSAPFWGGVLLLLLGLALSFLRRPATVQTAVVLVGIILTRMTFFGETLHTASNIGKPF